MKTSLLFVCLFMFLFGCAMHKQVKIESTPPGAEVFSEGRRIGKAPLTIRAEELMPNWNWDGRIPTRATVTMTKPGYDEYRLEVNEFNVPDEIHSSLVPLGLTESFESYIDQNPALQAATIESIDPPVIQTSQDLDTDSATLYGRGYLLVAYSGFSAEGVAMESVREQAKKIGASIVLLQSRFAGTETEHRAVTTHTSGGIASSFSAGNLTTTHSGSSTATVLGPKGAANVVGFYSGFGGAHFSRSGFTIIPGRSQTEFVPFSKRVYENQITFWRKRKANSLGAYCDYVPEEMRQKLERNTGAFVVAVEPDSPAFMADVLVGDVIVAIAGNPVNTPSELDSIAAGCRGQLVKVKLLRDGHSLEKSARIPQ